MVRLVISDNEGSTTVVPLLRDEVTIGRKEGNTIRLTERNISRRHVQLVRVGGIYKLRDLDSYNGVLVNGRKVDGESTITSGDQIQLGDYTILVEEEVARSAAPVPHGTMPASLPPPSGVAASMALSASYAQAPHAPSASTSLAPAPITPAHEPMPMPSRRPTVPARIVMLTPPASGAEFVLPTDAAARLGRSDEVDCPINHRSVSREHAEIRPVGDQFVIEDLGSANGVTINGRATKKAELRTGDIIELGQVVFRFVAAGEHYFFDPGEAARFRGASGGRSGANTRLAILLGVVTLAALVFVLLPTPDAPQSEPDSPVVLTEPDETGDKHPAADGTGDDGYDKAVLACRSALASSRFVEAAAHAQMALKVRPASPEALDCKQRADSQSMEEQAFVRGKDALSRGDAVLAYQEFSRLPEHSAFRTRPEVQQAMTEVANKRLEEARQTLPTSRGEAARLAQSVLGLPGVTSEQIAAAELLIAEARGETTGRVAQAARPAAAPAAKPAAAPPAQREPQREPVRVAEVSKPVSKPAPPPPPPPSAPVVRTTAPSPAPSSVVSASNGGAAPMEIANACLARGDNECVIHALDGTARTQQELGLLIETFRAVGDVKQAQKNMATYVKRFPDAQRSAGYRRMLELQGQ